MRCLADYVLKSDNLVVAGTKKLHLTDPLGGFECYIGNLTETDDPRLPRLSAEIVFESPTLKAAPEIAWEHLLHTMNLLAFVTNSRVEYHHLLRVIDWTPDVEMRQAFAYSKWDPEEAAQPILSEHFAKTVDLCFRSNPAPWLRRALRWFRLGIAEAVPDDMFQFFWFALEITADASKPSENANDLCPRCRGKLFCETCREYPTHRPYPKQAIRALIANVIRLFGPAIYGGMRDDVAAVIKKLDAAAIFDLLDKSRNALMHGASLKDVQKQLPMEAVYVVDLLGKITWLALLGGFDGEYFKSGPQIIAVSGYVRHHVAMHAHMSVAVPAEFDGSMDRDKFPKIKMSMTPYKGPAASGGDGKDRKSKA